MAELIVEELGGLGIATVMARKGVTGATIGAILEHGASHQTHVVPQRKLGSSSDVAAGPQLSLGNTDSDPPLAAPGVELPTGPGAAYANDLTVIGTGPESWLVIKANAAPDFTNQLSTLAGLASVSDQSGGYVVTRLTGPQARTVLQRGAAIDFHPDSFRPGSAVTTMIAHIGVIIWQTDDQPSYQLATFRSYAHSFRHWLDTTIATL